MHKLFLVAGIPLTLGLSAHAQTGYEWGKEFDTPHMAFGQIMDSAIWDDGNGPALYLAGEFQEIHGEMAFSVIRYDGEEWTPLGGGLFNINNPAQVRALEVYDPDGAGPAPEVLVAAGSFQSANGFNTFVQNVAAWDGTSWSALGSGIPTGIPGMGGVDVYDLQTFDDGSGPKLYAGGIFMHAGFRGIAAWDGTSWNSVASTGTSTGWLYDLHVFDDGSGPRLYAGGNFGAIVGAPNSANLAIWDGTSWSGTGAAWSEVHRMVTFDRDGAGPLPAVLVAASQGDLDVWDGGTLTNIPGFSAAYTPGLLAFDDGSGPAVYLGANTVYSFTGNRMYRWDGVSVSMTPVGSPLLEDSTPIAFIETLFTYQGKMYGGGVFKGTASAPSGDLLAWEAGDWTDPFPRRGLGGYPMGAALFDAGFGEEIFVGGGITDAGGLAIDSRLAAWNGSTWRDTGPIPGVAGAVTASVPLVTWNDGTGNALYVSVEHAGVNEVFKLSSAGWAAVGAGSAAFSGPIRLGTVYDDGSGPKLYVVSSTEIQRFDGSAWSVVGVANNNQVKAIEVFDDGTGPLLYLGGYFTSVSGVSASRLAIFDGSTWSALAGSLNSGVTSLVNADVGNGQALFVGGTFTSAAGVPGTVGLARWDGTSFTSVGGGDPATYGLIGTHDDGIRNRLYIQSYDPNVALWAPQVRSWDGAQWTTLPNSYAFGGLRGILKFDNGGGSSAYFWGAFNGSGGTLVDPLTSIDMANQAAGLVRWGEPLPQGVSYFCEGAAGACPCANPGAPLQGCANSSGAGGRLIAGGSVSLAIDDLTFVASNLPASQSALLFSGANEINGGAGLSFGDGLRCAGGSILRHGVRIASAGGDADWGQGLFASHFTGGDIRSFQVWYRDPVVGPCGSGFNLSNGATVAFLP